MDKFEYRSDAVIVETVNDPKHPNVPEFEVYLPHWNWWKDKSMRTSLAELGADGWELVSITEGMSEHKETPWKVAVFKRRMNQRSRGEQDA